MVVVVIIGLIAAIALPSMRLATYDRHAYQDAGAIMQLFREARMRSVARGSATLVSMYANGATDRGTFNLYEAVTQDPTDPQAQIPVPTCKAPQSPWTLPPSTKSIFIDGVNLNGAPEADGDIQTQIWTYGWTPGINGNATAPLTFTLYVCYTPIGRSYMGAVDPPNLSFNGLSPSLTVVEARVTRGATSGNIGATARSVIVEPNGMPRIMTKIL